MLRRLPGCDLRSGQEGAGEARARERARGAQGWGQPSAPGCASQKVQDQQDPRPTPPFTPTPPELGEGLVPLPALRFPASVSMHPFPPKNFHRALKLSMFCLPEVLRTNPFAPLVLVLDQRGCGELVIIAARKSLR